jgi:hypothetical protein
MPRLSCFEWGCLTSDIQHDLWILKGQIGDTKKIICRDHMMYNLEGFHDYADGPLYQTAVPFSIIPT